MRHPILAVALSLVTLTALPLAAQSASQGASVAGGSDDFGPYAPVANWLKPIREGFLEKGVSVWAETPDHIFVTTSVEFPAPTQGGGGGNAAANAPAPRNRALISVVDRNGNIKEVWDQWESLMVMPHYVTISPYDPTKAVWVLSRETDQVFKFTHDGKQLLMTLGQDRRTMPECVPATMPRCGNAGGVRREIRQDAGHFGQPTAIAFLPDGSFYISDGYSNRRVAKFDKDGKFLFEFGGVGTGPGQFAANGQVHGLAIDAQRRIYVCDRGNNRVQVFDENGRYLTEWANITGPSDIKITADGMAWVVSGRGNRLLQYDTRTGRLVTYWGTYGTGPGQFDDPHYISVDSEGNLYVAIFSNEKVGVEKYVPRPNADRSRMIGQFVVPPMTQN
jgi:peptidylamidoglycolate lyase